MVDRAENQPIIMDETSSFEIDNSHDIKVSSMEELMNLLQNMNGFSEQEREKIRLQILKQQVFDDNKIKEQIIDEQSPSYDYFVFIAMISIIVMVFVLFGYKLYKSLIEKQKKRQDKVKTKHSKKKK